jgi:hypothetical protein
VIAGHSLQQKVEERKAYLYPNHNKPTLFYMRKFLVIQFSKSELKYSHVIVVSGKMAKTVTISMKVD